MSLLPRWGYEDWRDVRNDIILLSCITKLITLGYLAYDWYRFSRHGFSYVIGYTVRYFGWDSPVTEWVRYIWGLGR